jgi:hypothetical protein
MNELYESDIGYGLTEENDHCPCCHGVGEHHACTLDGPEEWSDQDDA